MVPLMIIRFYQAIPWPRWAQAVLGSNGASARAIADIKAGRNAWAALWQHGRLHDVRDRSSWGGSQ